MTPSSQMPRMLKRPERISDQSRLFPFKARASSCPFLTFDYSSNAAMIGQTSKLYQTSRVEMSRENTRSGSSLSFRGVESTLSYPFQAWGRDYERLVIDFLSPGFWCLILIGSTFGDLCPPAPPKCM